MGQRAPEWLRALQTVYSTKSQEVGRCQEVARILHTAYSNLGQSPRFIAFRAKANADYISFDAPSGRIQTLTHTGYHADIQTGEFIRDGFTGPMGMKLPDYLARLHAIEGVTWEIVTLP
jgi:hypothetical protein